MADVPQALKEKLGDDYVCVFVPWSLNMTSGTNLFVKESDVIYLDISSESALQYMLTAGAVMPKKIGQPPSSQRDNGEQISLENHGAQDGKESNQQTAPEQEEGAAFASDARTGTKGEQR